MNLRELSLQEHDVATQHMHVSVLRIMPLLLEGYIMINPVTVTGQQLLVIVFLLCSCKISKRMKTLV